jgi:hypothetical protein
LTYYYKYNEIDKKRKNHKEKTLDPGQQENLSPADKWEIIRK